MTTVSPNRNERVKLSVRMHLLCYTCWYEKLPGAKPYIDPDFDYGKCCNCGQGTNLGIYMGGHARDYPKCPHARGRL